MRSFVERAMAKTEKLPAEEKIAIYEKILKDVSADDDFMVMVLDSISTGVIVCDNDFNVIFMNKHISRLLNLNKKEFSDIKVWEIFSNRKISSFLNKSLHSDKKKASKIFSTSFRKKNFSLEVKMNVLNHPSGKTGYIINIENVTDREQEKTNAKMAESVASLTALTAGVAHEIKNPLGSMSIYLQLMKRQLNSLDKDDFDVEQFSASMGKKIDVLDSEIKRLNDIVVDFLYTVRPMNTTLVKEALNPIVMDAVEFFIPDMTRNGIDIRTQLEENLPLLMLDKRYMRQVIINLMINARDAMKESVKKEITVTTEKNSSSVILTVSDTGKGIPEENLSKIFDPYFTTKDTGTGIGLTLVYKIIKGMGGSISVSSQIDKGTSVKIVLPRIEKEIKQIGWCENEI
ncbi:MAG: ATP-binding protein [Spirochaetia bacterium]|nr:ATP-binding protein [Spirochaetia bacterium]